MFDKVIGRSTRPTEVSLPAPTKPATSDAAADRTPATPASAKPAAKAAAKPADHAQLIADCHDLAHAAFAAMSRTAGADLLSLDLTMGQFKAMATLTMFGPQAVGALGRKLGLSEPAASLLVGKLEELDLAVRERDPADRRRHPGARRAASPGARPASARRPSRARQADARRADRRASSPASRRGLHGILRVSAALGDEEPGAGAERAAGTGAQERPQPAAGTGAQERPPAARSAAGKDGRNV